MDDQIKRSHAFLVSAITNFGEIITILGKDAEGQFSDHALGLIHARLQSLSDAALDVPELRSALLLLDHLVAMFPPRNSDPKGQ